MDTKKIAVVILAYADYESLEVSLAAHMKFAQPGVKYYILQNGRGTYDTEKTYRVALRYHYLFPNQVEVVDWIKPQPPYFSIKELLNSQAMAQYNYICKIDDDVFPVTENWLKNLFDCYDESYAKYGDNLAYVSGLVNNHYSGFEKILDFMDIKQKYLTEVAREHLVGFDGIGFREEQIVSKEEIYSGGAGTIMRYPYIARWLHEQTTLDINNYINKCGFKDNFEFNSDERMSINCILFKKNFWNIVEDSSPYEDEHRMHMWSKKHHPNIVVCPKALMVHLLYNSHREENKDMMPQIKAYYQKFLNLNYPISICSDINYENEARLRWIENKLNSFGKIENKKEKIYLFDFIPLLTKSYKGNNVKYKLFGFIPLLKIRRK